MSELKLSNEQTIEAVLFMRLIADANLFFDDNEHLVIDNVIIKLKSATPTETVAKLFLSSDLYEKIVGMYPLMLNKVTEIVINCSKDGTLDKKLFFILLETTYRMFVSQRELLNNLVIKSVGEDINNVLEMLHSSISNIINTTMVEKEDGKKLNNNLTVVK
jgi:hypothetical protein